MSARTKPEQAEKNFKGRPEDDTEDFVGSNQSTSKYAKTDPTERLTELTAHWYTLNSDVSDEVEAFVSDLLNEHYAAMVTAKRNATQAYNAESDLQVAQVQQELEHGETDAYVPDVTPASEPVKVPWYKRLFSSL